MDVLDGIADLTTHLLLITLHLKAAERGSFEHWIQIMGGKYYETDKTRIGERKGRRIDNIIRETETVKVAQKAVFVPRVCKGTDDSEAISGSLQRKSEKSTLGVSLYSCYKELGRIKMTGETYKSP